MTGGSGKGIRFAAVCAFAAACAGLCGCSRQYIFEDMAARYQSPDLPTQFSTPGETGWRVSGAFAISDEGRYMDNVRQDTLWPQYGFTDSGKAYFTQPRYDSAALAKAAVFQERYRFDRQPILAAVDLAYLRPHWYYGLAAGVGAPDLHCNYFGIYAGYSRSFFGDRIAPTIGLGVYVNRVRVSGRYWVHQQDYYIGPGNPDSNPEPPLFREDSVRAKTRGGFAAPFKMGLLYRWRPALQPYFLLHGNKVSLWPEENRDTERYEAQDVGLTLGVRNQSIPGLGILLELDYLMTEAPLETMNFGPMLTLRVQRRI